MMKVPVEDIVLFEFKEFVYSYIEDIFYYTNSNMEYFLENFFKISPYEFFKLAQAAGYFNDEFIEYFKNEYGLPWTSTRGYMDFASLREEVEDNVISSDVDIDEFFQYMVADIIVANDEWKKKLVDYYENNVYWSEPKQTFEVEPIPEEYKDVSEILGEYACDTPTKKVTNDELQELFEALLSISSDDMEKEIIEKIRGVVTKRGVL